MPTNVASLPMLLPPPRDTQRIESGPCTHCGGVAIARLKSGGGLCLGCGKAQA